MLTHADKGGLPRPGAPSLAPSRYLPPHRAAPPAGSVQGMKDHLGMPNVDQTLLERSLTTRGETIMVKLTPEQAALARDALAKAIYSKLFIWRAPPRSSCTPAAVHAAAARPTSVWAPARFR